MQNLIATKLGVQRITGITVFDKIEKITYDSLPDLEVDDFMVFSTDHQRLVLSALCSKFWFVQVRY